MSAAAAGAGAERVVVTGIGAVSPWGWSAEELWRGLASGDTRIADARRFDTRGHRTRVAGEVPSPPSGLAAGFPAWRRYSRADRFAVVAARAACAQAGISPGEPDPGLGVFFGGSTAGMPEAEEYFRGLLATPPRRARIGILSTHQINGPGDAVARWLGAAGPVQSFSSACASSALAIGAALDAVRDGDVEVAITGGADALCQLTYAGFNSLRAVAPEPCRPFRADRAGMSLGEGAGVLVLERASRAAARGAAALAEVLGAGASCDAHHMTAPQPRGEGAASAIARALADAGVAPAAIAFVNAHGTGTPLNDASEWHAVARVFGERASRLPLTSTKGSVGHFLGSSGAIEAVATIQCLLAGEVHATPGGGAPDPELGVDLVLEAPRPIPADACAVSVSFGFGGANAALVLAGRGSGRTP